MPPKVLFLKGPGRKGSATALRKGSEKEKVRGGNGVGVRHFFIREGRSSATFGPLRLDWRGAGLDPREVRKKVSGTITNPEGRG
jgi:hypothetical protein